MCPRPGQAAKENRGPLQDWLCQCGHSVIPAGTHKEPVGAMLRGGGQVMSETLGILVHGGDSSREPRPSLFTANIFVLVAVCLLAQPLLLSFISASDSSLLRTWEPKATHASVSRAQVERETYHQNKRVVFKIYGATPASEICCSGLVVLRAERILRTICTLASCCLDSSLRRGVHPNATSSNLSTRWRSPLGLSSCPEKSVTSNLLQNH